jgi:hypothetical protein
LLYSRKNLPEEYNGMINTFRQFPPDYSGSLKGLPGIAPPHCFLFIERPGYDVSDRQQRQRHRQEEDVSRRRIEKFIRRLLIKARVPVLSQEQRVQSHPNHYFIVKISLDLTEPFVTSVEMQMTQEVQLARDPAIKINAVTWHYGPMEKYFDSSDQEEEEVIQNRLYQLLQTNVLEGVHKLACSYKYENQIPHRSYNRRPLNES